MLKSRPHKRFHMEGVARISYSRDDLSCPRRICRMNPSALAGETPELKQFALQLLQLARDESAPRDGPDDRKARG